MIILDTIFYRFTFNLGRFQITKRMNNNHVYCSGFLPLDFLLTASSNVAALPMLHVCCVKLFRKLSIKSGGTPIKVDTGYVLTKFLNVLAIPRFSKSCKSMLKKITTCGLSFHKALGVNYTHYLQKFQI